MHKKIRRRQFLQQSGLASAGLMLPLSFSRCQASLESASSEDQFFRSFQEPAAEARPFFRWWWNDNQVTREEVIREIRLMKEAGAGGVEINPIGMIEIPGWEIPGEGLEWLSKSWNDVVKVAIDECLRQGMEADLIVGTGWPFGGEFLADEETIKGVELTTQKLQGPQQFVYHPQHSDAHHQLLQLLLVPEPLTDLESAQDLTDQLQADGSLTIELPAGNFRLYELSVRRKFREVQFGTYGGRGPVLDHFNKAAVEKYLNRMSDTLSEVINLRKVRSMFCDSIELEGANWTDDLLQEFSERRGYELMPYLALLMDKEAPLSAEMAATIKRVRYDHSLTLAELFEERFILPFHEWCQKIGVKSRYQSYGYPWLYTDLLQGYLIPDIPEGDQWLFNSGWVHDEYEIDQIRYAIWNKYASSGGHLTGKRVISSEAMTNTSGVFRASLEYMKQATDLDVIGGINHLVLHGFNYSPPEAGFPGWVHFGTYYNEQNPWWPYLRQWMDYTARLSQLFQDSRPVAKVAILGPTTDIWSDYGLDRNPFNTEPDYLHCLWQALSSHGVMSDYVNAQVVEQAEVKEGQLSYGPMQYELLLVCSARIIRPETARAIRSFAEAGGKILFIESLPSQAPGSQIAGNGEVEVQQLMRDMTSAFGQQVMLQPKPEVSQLPRWVGEQLKRMEVKQGVTLSEADKFTFVLHHQSEDRDIFFFTNSNKDKEISFRADFDTAEKTPWQWDAETGTRSVYSHQQKDRLDIRLAPLASLLLVFEPEMEEEASQAAVVGETIARLEGPWEVALNPVEGELFTRTFTELADLGQDDELNTFSGTLTYRTTFDGNDLSGARWLDLGSVHETAEVWLNSEALGLKWWGEKQFPVEGRILAGENVLEIKVTTLLFNYCHSLTENPVANYWANVRNKHKEGPLPTGLVGPVQWRA